MGVAIGVDSHKGTLAVAVLDNIGRAVGLGEFTNDARSHELLISWIAQYGSDRVIGIEGSGNYGAGLARRLLERDEDVREVPAFLSHRERRKTPSRGKFNVNDAVAIARVVARGDDRPRLGGPRPFGTSSSSATIVTSSFDPNATHEPDSQEPGHLASRLREPNPQAELEEEPTGSHVVAAQRSLGESRADS